MVESGQADIGIIPAYELSRQKLGIIPGVGIACRGAVRSILLVSKCPVPAIRTLAADSSSRTSVELARVVLARRYGAAPQIMRHPPALDAMLEGADAALLIGDPALRLDPDKLPYEVLDLGKEWTEMTGLPMVFAVWAGPEECISEPVIRAFQDSCRYGLVRMDEIVQSEAAARGFAPELVRRYLTSHIVFELGPREYEGLKAYLELAGAAPEDATARLAGTR